MFNEGDRVKLRDVASLKSIEFYSNIKEKYPTITCPCHIENFRVFSVVGYVAGRFVVVQLEDKPTVVTIFYAKDLYKL